MKNNHSLGVLGFLLCLRSGIVILGSCKPNLSERDFGLSQKRDDKLIGSWKGIPPSPTDDYVLIQEYTPEGEIKQYHNGTLFFMKSYFYTKGNILYVLTWGDGFKRSNWTVEYEYRFSEDGNLLYTKQQGGSEESKWQRINKTEKE